MKDLKDFFMEAGDVAFADCHKIRHGEGIVEFHREEDMRNAIRKLDGRELNGRRVRLTEVGFDYLLRIIQDRTEAIGAVSVIGTIGPVRRVAGIVVVAIVRAAAPVATPVLQFAVVAAHVLPVLPALPALRPAAAGTPAAALAVLHLRLPTTMTARLSPNSANDFNGEPVSPVVDDPFQDTSLKAGSPVAAAAATTTSGWE
ncbi:Serine-arginine protein 55 [Spiromyces aspiralis]|uniref:Serine-arginine protein 55 n=1 Tax=Spiromyces aspiralis TaxID=68401 RepID=A0ACC1HMT6_9FUNG|nr:Serine-arginine protein 55 [Spiromyces aspiralis]